MNLAKVETEVLPREPAPAHTSRNGVAKVIDPVNILIVDDREDKLLALQAILEPLGQNLVMARSGKAALRLLLKQEFAVILMDVSMPGMDGFETASLVRTRPACGPSTRPSSSSPRLAIHRLRCTGGIRSAQWTTF